MSSVRYVRDAEIARIIVDYPPVNALGQEVRAGLIDALRRAEADETVRALVILCEGRTFIAGADIREFGQAPQAPLLPEVTQAIENAAKPVIVALHGTALGGGFEVALAAHYRIAAADARVGLPEVRLGLIPGAGGTQRLPRLVGAQAALEMITTGEPISAERALAIGAIDEIAADELEPAALAAARRLAEERAAPCRTGLLPTGDMDPAVFTVAEQALAGKQRHLIAPRYAIEAVRAALTLPLDQGLRRERELFLELRASPQAVALRHAFLGEREVAKIPDLPADTPVRGIERIAVIGAGTMGRGIAMCCANAGLDVVLLDADADTLERGVASIREQYAGSVSRGRLSRTAMDERLARIRATPDWEETRSADLLIEAVFEDLSVKREVMERMDRFARPDATLATNTSYLDVATLAGYTRRPRDVVGMHFFSPAQVMRLLENVRTPSTAPEVLATVMKLGRRLGKVAVLVGGRDGFVGNRMLAQRSREIWFLLEEGALPRQVDRALVDFGFAMGPCAVADMAGLDIAWRARQALAQPRPSGVRDSTLLDKLCAAGRLGQKTGAGWYRYEPGKRTPLPDPEVERLIVEHSRELGIERRVISDEEIVQRCLHAMINEGARILEEGVASRSVDIDMVWLHGYGFPAWRGGPMFYADRLGLEQVYQTLCDLRERFGADCWTPAPLIEALARSGGSFHSLERFRMTA